MKMIVWLSAKLLTDTNKSKRLFCKIRQERVFNVVC